MPRLLDEGGRLFLRWGMGLAISITALFTAVLWLLLWLGTILGVSGAEAREERSAPYDRAKEFSTSMLYYPEQPMVEWPLKPYLDFIEGGNAAATPQQWAETLHRKSKIDEPTWSKARAYLATLKWQKNATKEWWRMYRVLRPYGKWKSGRLDAGYERTFEAGEWGLHDPTTGELVVAGDCGNVVVEKLGATAAAAPVAPPRPQPTAPAKVAEAPPPAVQPAPPPAEPSRVAKPPVPKPDGPSLETTVAKAVAPAPEAKVYIVYVIRDPKNELVPSWGESADVHELTALRTINAGMGEAVRVKDANGVFALTGYDANVPHPHKRGATVCDGKQIARYEVPVKDGFGLIRFGLADHQKAKCWRVEAPDHLKPLIRKPRTGMLDWAPLAHSRPDTLWFVLW
ncbi:hypothetical protein HYW67_01490 [Candidatus Parcubacteria bacterium]|nr:hypothetical protein [Candidatus Parcubacteria bacterium]